MQWLNQDYQVKLFVDKVVEAYNTPYLHQQKMYACNQVKDICTWDTVALQWKQHLYKKLGKYLPIEEYRKVTKINDKVRRVFNRRFMNTEELQPAKISDEKSIAVITPVYNAEAYIERCILSVAQQDYTDYHMYIIDDCSGDNTVEVAKKTIASLPEWQRWHFSVYKNEENVGAVANHFDTIKQLITEQVVILLDGDDSLVNDPTIFHMYNNLYHEGAEFTYGSCWSMVDNIPLIAQEYPPEVKANKTYRDYKFNWNMPYTHLRTFNTSLVKTLTREDLQIDGEWPRAGGDTALFYYLLEKADPEKVVCVTDIVYNYNDMNPLNDYKVNSDEQTATSQKIIAKPSPFLPGQIDLRPL
jgi:hypothetical protein